MLDEGDAVRHVARDRGTVAYRYVGALVQEGDPGAKDEGGALEQRPVRRRHTGLDVHVSGDLRDARVRVEGELVGRDVLGATPGRADREGRPVDVIAHVASGREDAVVADAERAGLRARTRDAEPLGRQKRREPARALRPLEVPVQADVEGTRAHAGLRAGS